MARYYRQESAYSESEYQEAKRRYNQQARDREDAEEVAKQTYRLDATEQASLKRLYREAAQLCHPDRVTAAHRLVATAKFQELQSAYQRQDRAAVLGLLENLRRGLFTAATNALTSVQVLRERRDALAATHTTLVRDLTALRSNSAYELAQADEASWLAYIQQNRGVLEGELTLLTAQLARLRAEKTVVD